MRTDMLALLLLGAQRLLFARASPQSTATLVPTPPQVTATRAIGPVLDPTLVRDSGGSAKFGDRSLWVFRDTQGAGFLTSSASWANLTNGTITFSSVPKPTYPEQVPLSAGYTQELLLYGNNSRTFYPYAKGDCTGAESGSCGNSTRTPLWADSPPLVTNTTSDGNVTGYTWIVQSLHEDNNGAAATVGDDYDLFTSLYRITYSPAVQGVNATLPTTEVVNSSFWGRKAIPFGAYGNVIVNSTAYLFGKWSPKGTGMSLARVTVDQIENAEFYEYWVNDRWTGVMPAINDTAAAINATTGGQGNFYFSEKWNMFVWIGGPSKVVPKAYMSVASNITGPWSTPSVILDVVPGNASIPEYSFQAHWDISPPDSVYISYTQTNTSNIANGGQVHRTILYLVEFNSSHGTLGRA